MNKAIKNTVFIIILFIAIQLVVQVISMVAGLLPVLTEAFRHQPENVADVFRENATVENLAVPLSVSTIVSSILTVFLFWKARYVHLDSKAVAGGVNAGVLILCVPLALTAMFFMNVLTELLPLQDNHEQTFEAMSRTGIWGFLAIAIFGPVCEEVTFRGAIEGGLLKCTSPWKAILWSAFLFGVIHMNPIQVPFAFALGVLLGWLYYKTGSLVAGLWVHIINNTLGFVTMVVTDSPKTTMDWLGKETTYILMVVSLLIFVVLLFYFNKTIDKTSRIKTIQ